MGFILVVGDVDTKHYETIVREVMRGSDHATGIQQISANLPTCTELSNIVSEEIRSTPKNKWPANLNLHFQNRLNELFAERVKKVLGDIQPSDILASVWESYDVQLNLIWLANALPTGIPEYVFKNNGELIRPGGLIPA